LRFSGQFNNRSLPSRRGVSDIITSQSIACLFQDALLENHPLFPNGDCYIDCRVVNRILSGAHFPQARSTTELGMPRLTIHLNFDEWQHEVAHSTQMQTDTCRSRSNYQKYTHLNPLVRRLVNHFLDTLIKTIVPLPIQTVLDVGCGEGFVMKTLTEHAPHVSLTGIDSSVEALTYARHLNPQAKLIRADAYAIPIQDDAYDLVLCTEVLEHLDSPQDALSEIQRISKRYCLLSVPNEPFFAD
jgi:hypothetical protein